MRFPQVFERNHTFFRWAYTAGSRPFRRSLGSVSATSNGGERGTAMRLDKKSIDRLLKLNDDQFRAVIGKLLTEYGVDVSRVPLASMDMGALRALLQMAGEEDISRLLTSLGGSRPS